MTHFNETQDDRVYWDSRLYWEEVNKFLAIEHRLPEANRGEMKRWMDAGFSPAGAAVMIADERRETTSDNKIQTASYNEACIRNDW